MINQTKVTAIGTGRFAFDDGRANQSILIEYKDTGIMVDCGATTPYLMKKTCIKYDRVDYIFLTHYHGDHTAGIPYISLDLLVNPDTPKRDKPLTIIGKHRVKQVIEALADGMGYKKPNPLVFYHNLQDGKLDLPDDITFDYLPMKHKEESVGYKFRVGDKTIGVSGDTNWTDNYVSLADGCDLFITECSQVDADEESPHLSFEEISSNLTELKCKRIRAVHLHKPVADAIDKLSEPKFGYFNDGDVIYI
jgi:ribonuclease BN (tRNA processing enzyme)